jgi:hypothetical protein
METEPRGEGGDKRSYFEKHRIFQRRVATLFLGTAAIVGIWIFAVPRPDGLTGAAVLLFVQLPLFVILALVGLNALIRSAKGPKQK